MGRRSLLAGPGAPAPGQRWRPKLSSDLLTLHWGSRPRRSVPGPGAGRGAAEVKARVGDKLIVEGEQARKALSIALPQAAGSPPYVVKGQRDGQISMIFPSQYSRILAS